MQRLTPKEAAQIIGYSVSTMKHWRRGKKVWEPGLPGPRFFSIHGRIFYSREALEDWERLCGSTRDNVGPGCAVPLAGKLWRFFHGLRPFGPRASDGPS